MGGPEEGRGMAGVVGRGRQFRALGTAVLRRPAQRVSGLPIFGGSSSIERNGAADHGRKGLPQVCLSRTRRLRDGYLLRLSRLRSAMDRLFGDSAASAPASSTGRCLHRARRRGCPALARSWRAGRARCSADVPQGTPPGAARPASFGGGRSQRINDYAPARQDIPENREDVHDIGTVLWYA